MPERKPGYKTGVSLGFLAVSVVAVAIMLQGCSAPVQEEESPSVLVQPETPSVSESSIVQVFKEQAGPDWNVEVDLSKQLLTVYFISPVGLPSLEPLAENLLVALEQVNEETGIAFDLELRGVQEEGGELLLAIENGIVAIES